MSASRCSELVTASAVETATLRTASAETQANVRRWSTVDGGLITRTLIRPAASIYEAARGRLVVAESDGTGAVDQSGNHGLKPFL